jgi:hypothetical protein
MTNLKLGVFAGAVLAAYVAAGLGSYYYGKDKGITEGLDNFHEACYTGGIIINEHTGKVVGCQPLGIVPKEEIPGFFPKGLDKSAKVV